MKFLFIVQGEGRGHLTQAITLENILLRNGHEVVEILVGKSESRRLPGFFTRSIHAPVKQFLSPNFLPTPVNKRVSLPRSIAYNILKLPEYGESIRYIRSRIQESGADIVINFYELLTGLTYFLFRPRVPQVCIGHQYLFLHKDFHLPEVDRWSMSLLNLFTRLTSLGATKRRVMIDLAEHADDGYIPMKEVAQRQGISLKYLERIMPALSKNNLVEGVHGKGGGYRLSRKPEDYTAGEILRLVEGSLAPVACLECGAEPCSRQDTCKTIAMWKKFYDLVNGYFDHITVADLVYGNLNTEDFQF